MSKDRAGMDSIGHIPIPKSQDDVGDAREKKQSGSGWKVSSHRRRERLNIDNISKHHPPRRFFTDNSPSAAVALPHGSEEQNVQVHHRKALEASYFQRHKNVSHGPRNTPGRKQKRRTRRKMNQEDRTQGTWTCPQCTFQNVAHDTACQVCQWSHFIFKNDRRGKSKNIGGIRQHHIVRTDQEPRFVASSKSKSSISQINPCSVDADIHKSPQSEFPTLSSSMSEVISPSPSPQHAEEDQDTGSDELIDLSTDRLPPCPLKDDCPILKDPLHLHHVGHTSKYFHPSYELLKNTTSLLRSVTTGDLPILPQISKIGGDTVQTESGTAKVKLSKVKLAREKSYPSPVSEPDGGAWGRATRQGQSLALRLQGKTTLHWPQDTLPPCPHAEKCVIWSRWCRISSLRENPESGSAVRPEALDTQVTKLEREHGFTVTQSAHLRQYSHPSSTVSTANGSKGHVAADSFAFKEIAAPVSKKGKSSASIGLDAGLVSKEAIGERIYQAAEDGQAKVLDHFLKSAEDRRDRRYDARELLGRIFPPHGETPLLAAARNGHDSAIRTLIRHRADLSASANDVTGGGMTALHLAALGGHDECVQTLIASHSSVETRDTHGFSALACAASRGNVSTVELLLQKKAAVDSQAKGGVTPLFLAAERGYALTVQRLVASGCNLRVRDKLGRSILDLLPSDRGEIAYAIRCGQKLRVQLLTAGQTESDDASSSAQVREQLQEEVAYDSSTPKRSNDDTGEDLLLPSAMPRLTSEESLRRFHQSLQLADQRDVLNDSSSFSGKEDTLSAVSSCSLDGSTGRRSSCAGIGVHKARAEKSGSFARSASSRQVSSDDCEPDQISRSSSTDETSAHTRIRLIKQNELHSVTKIAEGQFGTAYAAILGVSREEMEVVVKVPKKKPGADEWSEFKTFIHVPPHPHILPFVGICQDFRSQPHLCIVTEKQVSSLKHLLGDSVVLPIRIISVASQIAAALAHLHAHNIIHRDVAARNVLISRHGTAVLCDFGLSRTPDTKTSSARTEASNATTSGLVNYDDYYQVNQQQMLPLRWMAPESLEGGKFTRKSDVWMYGVLIWEILTQARFRPYDSTHHPNQVVIGVCTGALRLAQTLESVPKSLTILQEVLEDCLVINAKERPSMANIANRLQRHLGKKRSGHRAGMVKPGRACTATDLLSKKSPVTASSVSSAFGRRE